ncbi:hypothetical protein DB41_HW00200 [Neochlamydia sp. TUME1]|nr:hypothetical protein DB41_HW00200 [Neochlamydia sp. TUME1]
MWPYSSLIFLSHLKMLRAGRINFSTFLGQPLIICIIYTPEEGASTYYIVLGNLKNSFQKTMDGKNDCYHN